MCESMCEVVHLDHLFLSPKGGGEVEGGIHAKRRERRGAAPESTMTQKYKRLSNYANPKPANVSSLTNKI